MYLLGYDIGSSSVKTALVEAESGRCVASDFFPKSEAPIKALRPGWAEQQPDAWWSYLKDATASVLAESGVDPADIKAIGISYQMHGLVALDKNMIPLRDAIIWCDSRGVPYGGKAFEISTNPEGLSEYMLWDFRNNAPARFLMDYYGFDESILPRVGSTFSNQGALTPAAAAELGLAAGTPVTYRAGDQPNNALSLNVFEPGEVASTAGTSGVVYGINGTVDYDPLSRVNNFAHVNHTAAAPRIGVMSCISGTGILNTWIKRNVAPGNISYADMNDLAAQIAPGSEGISILPFGNGAERVLENREPGCSFLGINFNIHDRRHLIRAAQEGIVFAFMYGMEVMQGMGMKIDRIHAGHANMFLSPVFRETLASVSGAVIDLYDTDGAVGAAKGAGIGAGIYASPKEAFATLTKIGETEPNRNRTPYLEAYALWKQRLADIIGQ